MSITASCDGCRKPYRVNARYAGRRVRCPACGGAIAVPARAAIPVPVPSIYASNPAADRPAAAPRREDGPAADVPLAPPPLPAAPARPVRRTQAARPVVPAYGRQPADAWVRFPGEEWVDRLLPLIAFIGFVVAIVWPAVLGLDALKVRADMAGIEVTTEMKARFIWSYVKFLAILVPLAVCLPAGMLALSVVIASKAMTFERPDRLFLRALTVIGVPVAVNTAIAGLAMQEHGPQMPAGLWLIASFAMWLGALWLMFRLRPAAFAVTAAFSVLLAVAVPVILGVVAAIVIGINVNRARLANAGGPGVGSGPTVTHSSPDIPMPPMLAPPKLTPPRLPSRAPVRAPSSAAQPPTPPAVQPSAADDLKGPFTAIAVSPDEASTTPAPKPVPVPAPVGPAAPAAGRAPRGGPGGPVDRPAIEAALARIGRVAKAYADGHRGEYPLSLASLRAGGMLVDADLGPPGGGMPYAYIGPVSWVKAPLPATYVLAHDMGATDGQRTVLFGDGTVRTMPIAEFPHVMRESSAAMAERVRQAR